MDNYIPEDFGPDDDTEELPEREYVKAYKQSDLEFPDCELFSGCPTVEINSSDEDKKT